MTENGQASKGSELTIFCLEDDVTTRQRYEQRLTGAFAARVMTFGGYADACAALPATGCDLFLLDIEMAAGRATGIQLAEAIRQLPAYADTPILFASTYTHYTSRLHAAVGHCAFLPKPFTDEQLIAKVGGAAAHRRI